MNLAFIGPREETAAGQSKGFHVAGGGTEGQQIPIAVIGHQVIRLQQVLTSGAVEPLVLQAQPLPLVDWYSNKMRGVRQRRLPPQLVVRRPGVSPPPPLRLPSKRWRDLILQVWHVDPLRCPVCQNPMRVLGVIDDPRVVEKMLLNCRVDTRKAAR